MKHILSLLTVLALSACTILGAELDEKLGTEDDDTFTEIGMEFDSVIIEGVFMPRQDNEEEIDDRACPQQGTHQVCTATKGCWCEKTK